MLSIMDQGQTGGVPGSADSSGAPQSGTVPIEPHGGQSGMADAVGEAPKKSQSGSKKV